MARIEFYAQAALLKQQLTTGGNRTKIQRRTNREATQSDHVNHTQSRAVLRIIQVIYSAVTELGWDDGIRVLSAEPDFLTLKIRCNISTADRLQRFFEELKTQLDPEERSGVAMAFREMLLNAIEHGGKLDPNEWVRVSRIRSQRSLVYHMEDPGTGFSRSALEHAAVANTDDSPLDHVKVREETGMRMGG